MKKKILLLVLVLGLGGVCLRGQKYVVSTPISAMVFGFVPIQLEVVNKAKSEAGVFLLGLNQIV